MSIQLRLNLAIALLSALGLFCMIAFILIDAKPRMDDENASTMLLTETLIRSSLLPLKDSQDPKAALLRLVGELKNLRHASVSLISQEGAERPADQDDIEQSWLLGYNGHSFVPVRIPVEGRGEIIDTILITPKPSDEFSELLEAIFRIFEWGVIISTVTLALTWLIIDRSLRPIHGLRDAMRRMADGEFNLRVPEAGPPEIKSICGSLNGLAAALQKARQDNQRLTGNMILIQDQERRDIARELHDELGPYLFSIRTDGMLLGRELEQAEPDFRRTQRLNSQILGHVDLLQQTNRRVLERLTPPGLSELGLSGALRAMAEMWQRNKNSVTLELAIDGPIDALDETTKLTVYRIVQEGLTNAFRHSGASIITVDVSLQRDDAVEVSVRDNGRGRADSSAEGFGLKGMRERVNALSGLFSLTSTADGGTFLHIRLPATTPAERDTPRPGDLLQGE
ncbi:ATP-binding protein [Hyphomicrobium sp.]|uniref:ATP-binding protein n=1 Tax=Hyphomicrobium sp. TaxID=82 RepID=UPI000FA65298|nr:ATP-binding protein [Hyphomicrobium sp.]MBN9248248.1 HAMP domain-containing protein [Hyphomicrobium sp.]RUP10749.1 MAG: HAMP domain-containing protein [Hyphomicrobium sp.]